MLTRRRGPTPRHVDADYRRFPEPCTLVNAPSCPATPPRCPPGSQVSQLGFSSALLARVTRFMVSDLRGSSSRIELWILGIVFFFFVEQVECWGMFGKRCGPSCGVRTKRECCEGSGRMLESV